MPRPIARDAVLLVKMTPGATSEARALGKGTRVLTNSRRPDEITLGRRRYDLTRVADRAGFAAALGLRGTRAASVADALCRANQGARDELAALARVLAAAERGTAPVRRVVISGHFAVGGLARGNHPGAPHESRPYNGTLTLEPLRLLVSAFPRAAAQVEHLMLAVCFSGDALWARFRPDPLRTYGAIFPRLRSVTAYGDRAPRSGAGAEADLARWARATRSSATPRREQVFGACNAAPQTKAQRHRAGGVVFTARGAQRCAYDVTDRL